MIRTNLVKLSVIPAVAYRQKLPGSGTGLVILREGYSQPGIASISKTSRKAIPAPNIPETGFPQKAFREAFELTAGLPFKHLGTARYEAEKIFEDKPVPEPELKEIEMLVDGDEYKAVVGFYSDKNGKLSYDLINKDFIQFASRSSKVREMIEEKKSVEVIRRYIAGTKFRTITGNHELTNRQVQNIADLMDEVSPKGLFKELNAYLRSKLSDNKRKMR